jgi:hypothetical protein
MNQLERLKELIATYSRHGWRLRRALLRPETRGSLTPGPEIEALFDDAQTAESIVDALWFARPSHAGREAWELRLVGDTPYALFETFEADEAEEDRQDVRLEMEARLREYAEGRQK